MYAAVLSDMNIQDLGYEKNLNIRMKHIRHLFQY